MAKALLLSWLEDTLGPYVDNLTTDNLRMGVMAGALEFHNLHLKPLALAKFNLPFIVHKFARIKFLRIVIPWTNLGGDIPVQLSVDGVYVQIDPLDYGVLGKEEIETRNNELRKEILRVATSLAMESGLKSLFQSRSTGGEQEKEGDSKKRAGGGASSSSSSATGATVASVRSSNTYLQRLFAKIVANIEVSVRNLHFRYEDTQTLVGQAISAGVTLDELLIVSTDDSWNQHASEKASAAGGGSSKVPKFKVASLKNMTAYWNTDATTMNGKGSLSGEVWEQAMAGLVYKEAIRDIQGGGATVGGPTDGKGREDMRYLLSAPNLVAVKLCDRSLVKPSKSAAALVVTEPPVLDMSMDTGMQLNLALDSTQLLQICLVLDNFAATERSKFLKLFRPTDRPTKDPRAWWIYAYRLVTGRDDGTSFWSFRRRAALCCLLAKHLYAKQNLS